MMTGFTFADVYDEVIARAGGEQSTAEDVIKVRRGLRLLLERFEARGYNTWRIRCLRMMATGGSPIVMLPDCVDDVIHVLADGSELTRRPADYYMTIGSKERTGRPSLYWLDRQVPPRLHLYPTGDGTPLEVWYVERPEDFDVAADGIDDIPGRWLEAVILGLAADLAKKRPNPGGEYREDLIQRLMVEAREAEDIAQRADRDRTKFRYRIAF